MGGNYVYPGGRVDQGDASLEIQSFSRGITAEETQKIFGFASSPQECLAFLIAAIRELFEEAGVLLAYDHTGKILELRDPEQHEKFSDYRSMLQRGEITLSSIAKKENLSLALDQLRYYAHWITPEARPERFDTYFFIARYPSGQEASHDQKETTAGVWVSPRDALDKNLRGEAVLSPPTLKTLEDLSRFKTTAEIFKALENRESQAILPVLTKISSGPMLIFPWDPEYELFRKGKIPTSMEHGRLSQAPDNTTRLIMKEGRWLPYCRD